MKVMEPDVTILIPVRNGEDFIAEAINSVVQQTFGRWELVVRDNCSKDGTRALVEPYLSDPRFRLIAGDTDYSMFGNFNQCLALVRTKYYMVLCHDDYLYAPNALQAAYDVMEADPSLPTVYCDLMYVDRRRDPILRRTFGRSGLIDSGTLARSSIIRMRNMFGIPLLARTSALNGRRYDETLPYVADIELSLATASGASIYHIPESLIANRYHDKNRTGHLVHGVFEQMTSLARRHGIPLSPAERVRMRVAAYWMALAKRVFLIYARTLKLAFRFRSRPRAENVKTAS